MNRPLVVDATSIARLVRDGVLADRLKALLARMEAMPIPDDPGSMYQDDMPVTGYAVGRAPRFALSVFGERVAGTWPGRRMPGWWPSTRIARVCRTLLDPSTEIVIDPARRSEVSDALTRAETVAGAVSRPWVDAAPVPPPTGRPGARRHWTYADDPFGDGVPVAHDRHRDPCPVPPPVLAACFAGAPLLAHLVPEGGTRKVNLRWGVNSGGDISPEDACEDPMAVMRVLAGHAHLLPRRAA